MPILGLDELVFTSIFNLALNASPSFQLVLFSGTFRDCLALKISNKVISDEYEHGHIQYAVVDEKTLSLDSREEFPIGCSSCVEDIPPGCCGFFNIGGCWLDLGCKLDHPYYGFRDTRLVFQGSSSVSQSQ